VDTTPSVNRRNFLVVGSLATAVTVLQLTGGLATVPNRAYADTITPSDMQFDIGDFITAPQTIDGVTLQMPPVHTLFLTAQLVRRPSPADQTELDRTLNAMETAYPWSAAGLITFVSYGLPYFNRLNQNVVTANMPHLLSDTTRPVLEEARPAASDLFPGGRTTSKLRFGVPVTIEQNDLVFMLRSDNADFLQDAAAFLAGSNTLRGTPVPSPRFAGLLRFTSSRAMFVQQGLPRSVAEQEGLPYSWTMQADSPMWMGFFDQHTNGAGPAEICTFVGNDSARLTTAAPGDYFDNGSIQHLSHNIIDMLQWFDMAAPTAPPGADATFDERVQYMFHAPAINLGNEDDPFTDGGGPSILQNEYRGPLYALQTAQGIGIGNDDNPNEPRVGHLSALQRSSRAADGTPIHIRMDGPGYDSMDVPDGSAQPKLQFTIFVPTSDFFLTMRGNQAAADLEHQYGMAAEDNGLERFITATRRQNYLIPPRRHRAFPLVEIGG